MLLLVTFASFGTIMAFDAHTPRMITSLLALAYTLLVVSGGDVVLPIQNDRSNNVKGAIRWQEPHPRRIPPTDKIPKRERNSAQQNEKNTNNPRILNPNNKHAKKKVQEPKQQTKAAKKGVHSRLGDWALCSVSSECRNGCCSNFDSDDGRGRCIPSEGGLRSDLCVVTRSGTFPTNLSVPASTFAPSTVPPTPPGPQYGLQQDCLQDDPSRFNICLDLGSKSGLYQPWMDSAIAARDRWLQVISADTLPATDTTRLYLENPDRVPEGVATRLPPYIDDIYISIVESDIGNDGPMGTLGVAGPLFTHTNSAGRKLPYYARIRLDAADLARMYADNTLGAVIEHEIGHALGFGWKSFVDNGLISGLPGDSKYLGQYAQQEWEAMGCSGDTPLEVDEETGKPEGHWDERCLNKELMTSKTDVAISRYRSRLTIGVMKDLGYMVNVDAADAFTLDQLSESQCASYCPEARGNFSFAGSSSFHQDINNTVEERIGILLVAAAELQRNRENPPSSLPEGTEYVGGDVVTVLIKDSRGRIKGMPVTWEDVEEYFEEVNQQVQPLTGK